VSTGIDQELKAAFETSSEFVQPPADLTESVRTATRRHRRRMAVAVSAATAVVLVAAGSSYLATGARQSGPEASRARPWHAITLPPGYQAQQLALDGRYLYVLAGEAGASYTLTAYSRASGQLIRSVPVPAGPAALVVGPGGFVWLSFYPDPGKSTGTWLLSPNLRLRSSYPSVAESPIVPVGRTTAFAVTQYGLVTFHMPLPGQSGRASQHLDPGTSVGPARNTAPGVWAGLLGGRVVAQVTDGDGFHSHLVIAGQPGRTFGGAQQRQAGSVASTGSSLWVEMFAVKDNNAAQSGPLVRLNPQLRATTPAAIQHSSMFARTENVWSSGDTVWVATAATGHALVCFASGTQPGPVITVRARGSVAALAAAAKTVYVTTTPPHSYDNSVITSYPVPAACR
jgi:hypothetical protein